MVRKNFVPHGFPMWEAFSQFENVDVKYPIRIHLNARRLGRLCQLVRALSMGLEQRLLSVKRFILNFTFGLMAMTALTSCGWGGRGQANSQSELQSSYQQMHDSLTQVFTSAYRAFESELGQNLLAGTDDGVILQESVSYAQSESMLALSEKVAQRRNDHPVRGEGYVLMGTRAELKEAGVIDNQGQIIKSQMDEPSTWVIKHRQVVRRDQFRYVLLKSAAVNVLTSHPTKAYRLMMQDRGKVEMEIVDENTFWNNSSYLVILLDSWR